MRWLRIVLFFGLDTLAMMVPKRRSNAALIVRLDAIGDFVIWLQSGAADIAAELRSGHERLILLANPAWASLARDLKLWDEVVTIDPGRFVRSPTYRFRTMLKIRDLGCSIAVQPRAARLLLLEDAIVRACGASVRVGSDALMANMTPRLRSLGNRVYTRIVPVPLALTVHESVRDMAFARAFCKTVGNVIQPSRLPAPASGSVVPAEPYIVVAVGAGWSGRQWPIEKFAALLSELHSAHGLRCVLIGSASEQPLAQAVLRRTSATVEDCCGRLSLTDSVRLIGRCRLLIANESGPMHLGVWCGVPVLGLVGGGHFGWFAPYPSGFAHRAPAEFVHHAMPCFQCNWHCKFDVPAGDPVPCVRDIESETVARRAHHLLAAGTAALPS